MLYSPSKQLGITNIEPENDVSNEFYEEYAKLIDSIKKHENKSKKIKSKRIPTIESISAGASPQRIKGKKSQSKYKSKN